MDGFLGQIMYFGGNFAPLNWAFAQGQLYPISQWSALYSILGTTYGGDARTSFGLPNAQGAFIVGEGSSNADPYNFRAGEKGGSTSITLTENQLPTHTHGGIVSPLSAPANNQSNLPIADGSIGSSTPSGPNAAAIYSTDLGGQTMIPLHDDTLVISEEGLSQPIPILPPYLCLYPVICLTGDYPSRN